MIKNLMENVILTLMGSLMLNSIPRPKENSIHSLKDSMTEKKIRKPRGRLMENWIQKPKAN